jgi:acyl-CoA synthetase (AMP-forming)/AMP-acid ligase II
MHCDVTVVWLNLNYGGNSTFKGAKFPMLDIYDVEIIALYYLIPPLNIAHLIFFTFQGFGLTETSCAATFVPSWTGLDKIGSCGVPLPQTEVKVVDGEGHALPTGSEGELWVKGPQVMQGYHRNEAATMETLTPDGWLRTGDVARIDNEGFVFVVDRLKELIKVKGLQVRHILNFNNLLALIY